MSRQNRISKNRGVIVEIRLENFITYSNVIIHPGRNMNVIIGPNGTGKSTIVTALALGFGGTPKLIGKPELPVGSTVKAGCQSARIDLTIKDTETKNVTLSRTIDVRSKSTWLIDNTLVTMAKFKEVVRDFNIQVDNLTQFLPQENIKGFSELSGQQLLQQTEKSVADTSLQEYHQTLITNRQRQKALLEEKSSKTKRLESAQQKFEGLTAEVNQFQERKNLKKKLSHLRQKRAWIEYDVARKTYRDAKVQRDDAARKMKAFDEQLTPIDDLIHSLNAESQNLNRKLEKHNQHLVGFNRKYDKLLDDVDDINGKVKIEEEKCKADIEQEGQRDQKIHVARLGKEKLDNDLIAFEQECGSETLIQRQVSELMVKLDEQRALINNFSRDLHSKRMASDQVQYEIGNIAREQQMLKDVESKRLEILMTKSRDAHKGVMWLRSHTHLFRAKVWEPMMLHIQVKEENYAKYFENVIAARDLISFVCEDKEDMTLLLSHLRRQMSLQVNAVHSDPHRMVHMTPNISLDSIKRFGFTHYLIDLIDAPEPILKYIVRTYNIQNIPIGTSKINSTFQQVPAQFNTFFSEHKHYSILRSQYSGEKSARIREISKTGMLSLVLDTAKIRANEEKLVHLNARKDTVMKEVQSLQKKIEVAEQTMNTLRDERHKCNHNIQKLQNIRSQITVAQHKLNSLEVERVSIDDIKTRRNQKISVLIQKQMKIYEEINSLCEECFKIVKVSESLGFQVKAKGRLITMKKMESEDLREKAKDAERVFTELDKKLDQLNKDAKNLYETARESTEGFTPQDKEQFRSFNAAFGKLPSSIDDINDMIEQTQARVYCVRDNPDVENVLREYEKTKNQINNYNDNLEAMEAELATNQKQIDELKEKWLVPLQTLINKISANFSGYLEKLGCAGQVNLIHGDDPNDFDSYALKIMVKFRENEPLQEFNKNRQSGGERSLTTAMYMIALQEMSQVPFRCVDEINQGMDATNDRKVFELIMEITAKSDTSQYFLLTPKLLPDLVYNSNVAVLCVFNGPKVPSYTDWNIDNYANQPVGKKSRREIESY